MSLSCNDCFRSIEPGATACSCGWKVPPKLTPAPERTYTSRMPPPEKPRCESPFARECREAWAKSKAAREQREFGKPVPGTAGAAVRQPGEDDDMVPA